MRFKEYNIYSLYRTSEGSKEKNIMETSLTNKKKIVKKIWQTINIVFQAGGGNL